MSDSAPAKRWFYVRDGRRHGPVDARDVVDHILAGDITEDALVWHSGLPEWKPAREVDGIREELPPPVPLPAAPAPPEPVSDDDEDDEDDDADEGGDDETEDDASDHDAAPGPEATGDGLAASDRASGETSEDGARRRRRRRKRKVHHHRPARRLPTWLAPLLVVLVALMIGLWWLLRRMNEVPPGAIIQTGSVGVAGSGYRVALGRDPSTTVSDTSWPARFTTSATSSPGFFSPSA